MELLVGGVVRVSQRGLSKIAAATKSLSWLRGPSAAAELVDHYGLPTC